MNTLDLLILASVALGLVIGLRSGLIKQVLSFAGLLAAFVLSLHLMEPVGAMAAESLGISADIAPIVGFVLVFLVVQVAVFALTRMLEALVGALKLTALNRLLGGAVGAFKAGLVLSVAFLVFGFMEVPSEETKQNSTLFEPVSAVVPETWNYVTAAFPQVVSVSERFGKELKQQVAPTGDAPGSAP